MDPPPNCRYALGARAAFLSGAGSSILALTSGRKGDVFGQAPRERCDAAVAAAMSVSCVAVVLAKYGDERARSPLLYATDTISLLTLLVHARPCVAARSVCRRHDWQGPRHDSFTPWCARHCGRRQSLRRALR